MTDAIPLCETRRPRAIEVAPVLGAASFSCAVRIISRGTLVAFWTKHPQSKVPLSAWFFEAERAVWTSPASIKARFSSADILAGDRVVFNIGGNDFRLIVHVRYVAKCVYIRFVGTHAEYDRVDASTV